jgi:hypothetical protein
MSAVSGPDVTSLQTIISYDPANKVSYSTNVHPRALDIFGWAELSRGAERGSMSRDTLLSPVGNTPVRVVPTDAVNGGYLLTYNTIADNLAPAISGDTWTFSFWAKANKNIVATSFIFEANSSGAYIQAPSKNYNLTTEWQRFEQTYTFINPLTTSVQVRVDWQPDTTAIYWFDGFQVEKTSSATRFNPTKINNGLTLRDMSGNNFNLPLLSSDAFSTNNQGCVVFSSATTGRNQTNMYNLTGPLVGSKDNVQWDGNSTHEAWVSPSVVDATQRFIFSDNNNNEGFVSFTSTQTQASFGGSNTVTTSSIILVPNVWYHIAMVHHKDDPTDRYRFQFYINGQQIGNVSNNVISTTSAVYGPDSSMRIGHLFTGRFGPIKVYNTNLSAAQIKKNYESMKRRFGL